MNLPWMHGKPVLLLAVLFSSCRLRGIHGWARADRNISKKTALVEQEYRIPEASRSDTENECV